jgi:hypothetical protein
MDFKKIISIALIPIVALVVLGVINAVSGVVLNSGLLAIVGFVISVGIFAISCLILAYSGYSATKKNKLDLLSAALVGGIAGFVSAVINGIIGLILMAAGLSAVASQIPTETGATGTAVIVGIGIVVVLLGIGFWFVAGLVLGAIGGFVGQRM